MQTERGRSPINFTVIFLLAGLVAPAAAETSLKVDIGWAGLHRWGCWAPVFLTVADPTPRNVNVDVLVPHGGGLSMRVTTRITVSPKPAVYPVFVPLGNQPDEMMIVLRDARSGRRLVDWPPWEQRQSMVAPNAPETVFITSGAAPTMRSLSSAVRSDRLQVGFVDALKLPPHAVGYEALNALVLNQPDLGRMSLEQQQAIVDWVRAGGQLIFWPGPDALPAASPVAAALPVDVGENTVLEIDPAILRSAGLPERFRQMKSRVMIPRGEGATSQPLFAGAATDVADDVPQAFRADFGLGRILVLPVDPTFFVFSDEAAARNFWRPLVSGIIDIPEDGDDAAAAQYWGDPHMQRRGTAYSRIADRLGDVPGVGRFGFTYVAMVLIALMLVVGPIDWFVLKLLGRQPWTWFTTAGWIILVTTGAICAGQLFKSGDLHYRSLRVVDQVDGTTVAASDLICIYAPRTASYSLAAAGRDSWWQPGAQYMWSGRSTVMDIPFEQDARGTRPLPMLINVWNLRFLQSESMGAGPPAIAASLSLRQTPQGPRYVGTIRNASARAMKNVVICSRPRNGGLAGLLEQIRMACSTSDELKHLGPGEQAEIDLPVAQRSVQQLTYEHVDDGLWYAAHELSITRGLAVERALAASDEVACIFAEIEDPAPPAKLDDPTAIEKHWQVVRALVRVPRVREQSQ